MSDGHFDPLVFGVTGALRTGHVALDLLLVVLVPTMIGLAKTAANEMVVPLASSVARRFFRQKTFRRVIRDEKRVMRWCSESVDPDSRNGLLQKAIALYVSERGGLARENDARLELVGNDLISAVPDDSWVDVDNVRLMRCKDEDDDEIEIVDVILEHRGASVDPVDDLVKAAWQYYVSKVDAAEKPHQRYLYVRRRPDSSSNDDDDEEEAESAAPRHSRYPLDVSKTFDTLWFAEKNIVLSLLDSLFEKRGTFAVRGAARKFGLLLHGDSGCGTTSIIRALAHRSDRNIVSVDLARIKTNQELMDAVFDLTFSVPDLDCPVKLNFEQCIIVLENIDSVSAVASRDDDDHHHHHHHHKNTDQPLLNQEHDLLLKKLLSSKVITVEAEKDEEDALDLSGILNVLDGVVDSPDRIVVVTSKKNPDRLDPALVRPGRIDYVLRLKNLETEDALCLAQNVLGIVLDDQQRSRFRAVYRPVSPAHLEQLCAFSNNFDEIIHTLAPNTGTALASTLTPRPTRHFPRTSSSPLTSLPRTRTVTA